MRYIVGFLIAIGLIVLLFVWIFHGGSGTPKTSQPQLITYANTGTVMQYTDDYSVVADQQHREVVITVGRDQTTFSVLGGYQNQVLRTQTYGNTEASYAVFLQALQHENFNNGNTSNKALQDERGYCPEGHRYIFEVTDGSTVKQRLWTSSCGIGTFKGQTDTVRNLFRKQIPDYDTLIENIGLY